MMSEAKTDKKTESINALRNANKHLADLFTEMNKKDSVLSNTSSELNYVAGQLGDIKVSVYVGSNRTDVYLKTFLQTCAKNLEGARS